MLVSAVVWKASIRRCYKPLYSFLKAGNQNQPVVRFCFGFPLLVVK